MPYLPKRLRPILVAFVLAAPCAHAQCIDWYDGFAASENGVNGAVRVMLPAEVAGEPVLFVGGDFTQAGGEPMKGIGQWDGESWTPLAEGVRGSVRALAIYDDGGGPALYAAGAFDQAGGAPAASIAKWNGVSWTALALSMQGSVNAITEHDGNLYIGGQLQEVDGQPVTNIAHWTGEWHPVKPAPNAPVHALLSFDDGSGTALFVGGEFTKVGSVTMQAIAKLTPDKWVPVGTGLAGSGAATCFVLAPFDDALGVALYAGGSFLTAGGNLANHIAKWDGAAWSALNVGAADGGGVDGPAYGLATGFAGFWPALYVAGDFTSTDKLGGRLPASNIARWTAQGWERLGDGIVGLAAYAVSTDSLGAPLQVGGDFDIAGGKPSDNLAAWGVPCRPPTITLQPLSQSGRPLRPIVFTVDVVGTRPFTYQWRRDGVPLAPDDRISGVDTDTLRIDPWILTDDGLYDIVVSNTHGSATSDSAQLTTNDGPNGGVVAVTPVIFPPQEVPWAPGNEFYEATTPAQSGAGDVVLTASYPEHRRDLVHWYDGELSLIHSMGDRAPGTPEGVVFGESNNVGFTSWLAGANGRILFSSNLDGPGISSENGSGIWLREHGASTLVARCGDQAAGYPVGALHSDDWTFGLRRGRLSDNGWVAFRSAVTGAGHDPSVHQGVWRYSAAGGQELIAATLAQAPGGGNFYRMLSPAFAGEDGRVLINAELDTTTGYHYFGTHDTGLWIGAPGSLQVIVRSGDDAPGFPKGTNLEVIGTGDGAGTLLTDDSVHFMSIVAGPDNYRKRVIYAASNGRLSPIVREDGPIHDDTFDTTFRWPTLHAANNLGRVVFSSTLNDCLTCPDGGAWLYDGELHTSLFLSDTEPPGLPDYEFPQVANAASINDFQQVVLEVDLDGGLVGVFGWIRSHGLFPVVVPGSQIEVAPGDIRVARQASLAYVDGAIDDSNRTGLSDHGDVALQIVFVGGTYGVFVGNFTDFSTTFFPCVADINGDGAMNLFDFLTYQTFYSEGDARADFAAPFGTLNIFDFLAFQTVFGNGC